MGVVVDDIASKSLKGIFIEENIKLRLSIPNMRCLKFLLLCIGMIISFRPNYSKPSGFLVFYLKLLKKLKVFLPVNEIQSI